MKPLLILIRIAFVGIFWSILFLEGIRVIMLTNWHFDILRLDHWLYAWHLWLSGWIIDDPKEWAFILIILTFIPVWLTGWTALSLIHWGKIIAKILSLPLKIINKLFEKQVKKIANTASVKVVKKKKSYKEIRPRSIRPPLEESAYSLATDKKAALSGIAPKNKPISKSASTPTKEVDTPVEFSHSLFKFDDDNSGFDFDLFDESPKEEAQKSNLSSPKETIQQETPKKINKPTKPESNGKNGQKNAATPHSSTNSTLEVLKQKGYEVITGATIKSTLIDFIGISGTQICLCLNDKEPGDWLADEERFNDEEPLWFSESSHRISPVRKLDIARLILTEKLSEAEMPFKVEAYVIEQIGNIINAEDMFEIWDNMNIHVTRIDRGTPKEIKLFNKALEDADGKIDKPDLEKIKKLIRSIA